jgi:hypothetical protein
MHVNAIQFSAITCDFFGVVDDPPHGIHHTVIKGKHPSDNGYDQLAILSYLVLLQRAGV